MQSEIIRNRPKAKQLMAFDGMQYGKCRPTDIDVSMDWQGKTFIFVEMKTQGAPLTIGQRIHLEGLVRAIVAGGKHAIAILAIHVTPDCEEDVQVSTAIPIMKFDGSEKKWTHMDTPDTLDDMLVELHEEHLERNKK
jgi:hypothetical protein